MPIAAPRPETWITTTPAGLYCEPGDFFIDPSRPVARAVITHGHGDHARPGNARRAGDGRDARHHAGALWARARAARCSRSPMARHCAIGGVTFRLVPAGHILGSAQVVLEHRGSRIVVSGDYKRRPDPTCAPFEPQSCDIFITEATFGLPVFRHPADAGEIDRLLHSLRSFPSAAISSASMRWANASAC